MVGVVCSVQTAAAVVRSSLVWCCASPTTDRLCTTPRPASPSPRHVLARAVLVRQPAHCRAMSRRHGSPPPGTLYVFVDCVTILSTVFCLIAKEVPLIYCSSHMYLCSVRAIQMSCIMQIMTGIEVNSKAYFPKLREYCPSAESTRAIFPQLREIRLTIDR